MNNAWHIHKKAQGERVDFLKLSQKFMLMQWKPLNGLRLPVPRIRM